MFTGWTRIIVQWMILLVVFASVCGEQSLAQSDAVTTEERAWLAAHPVIRLAIDPAYQPVEFVDERGQYRGITAEYITLLEQRLGLRFQLVQIPLVKRLLIGPDELGVDVRAISAATPERQQKWLFSPPYLEFPAYLITRKNVNDDVTINHLSGARISVVADYAVREFLSTNHPNVIIDPVSDTRLGLRKVSFGLVDGMVSDLPVATHWMEQEGLSNLKLTSVSGYVYRMGFATRKDWPELHRILEKGLRQIKPEERTTIYRKWVKMPPTPILTQQQFWLALLGGFGLAGLGLVGVLFWNRTLAAKVKQRTATVQKELNDRQQIEQELRASEQRFTTIFRSSPNPLGIARFSDSEILDVNDRWVQLSGYSRAELIGQQALKSKLWEGLREGQQIVQLLQKQRRVRDLEISYRDKGGAQRTALLSIEALVLGGELCNLWAIQDLTDRKRIEEALQQSEALFRSLTETTSAWVFIAQGTRLCYFNAAAEAGLGYTRAELVGQEIWGVIHPDDHQLIRERIQRRRQGLPLPLIHETRVLTKTGETRWIQISTTVIEYEQAAAELSTAFDITDRKCAEEQLKISEQQLHQLAGYLQTVREDERTTMAREIHDELGQALTAMKMDIVWLTHRLSKSDDALQKRLAATIELINATINTVRKLATQLRPGILDDLGLTAALEWQAQEFQARTGILCEFDHLAENLELEPARATAVFRICQEALTNVARHAQATKVGISLQQGTLDLVLEVTDNGRGITDNELANPHSLGLLGMRERAFLLGGNFSIKGRPNRGTTVTAQIPLFQSKAKGGAS
jgi:PAS domain S-box-containing protein